MFAFRRVLLFSVVIFPSVRRRKPGSRLGHLASEVCVIGACRKVEDGRSKEIAPGQNAAGPHLEMASLEIIFARGRFWDAIRKNERSER